jgi:hypothetical protein
VSILWRGRWVKDIWAGGILFPVQRQFKNGSCFLDTPSFRTRFSSLRWNEDESSRSLEGARKKPEVALHEFAPYLPPSFHLPKGGIPLFGKEGQGRFG